MLSGVSAIDSKQGNALFLRGWVFLLVGCLMLDAPPQASSQDHNTWRSYGGSEDGTQYSGLTQINRSNVKQLQVAWTYRTGDDRRYAFNPLVIDGTMYVLAKKNSMVALDAATGKEIWTHPTDPENNTDHQSRH